MSDNNETYFYYDKNILPIIFKFNKFINPKVSFIVACNNGHIYMAKYFLSFLKVSDDTKWEWNDQSYINQGIKCAVIKSQENIVKWLLDANIINKNNKHKIIGCAIQCNQTKIIQIISENLNYLIDSYYSYIEFDTEPIFSKICEQGNIDALNDTKSNKKFLITKVKNHAFNHIQYQNINK